MMEMVNMEGFGNPFMPFGGKFEDSADEGEFDDGDEDFYFDDEEEGYDLDDEYDEGDMLDVKPPMGMRANGSLEGTYAYTLRFILDIMLICFKMLVKLNFISFYNFPSKT